MYSSIQPNYYTKTCIMLGHNSSICINRNLHNRPICKTNQSIMKMLMRIVFLYSICSILRVFIINYIVYLRKKKWKKATKKEITDKFLEILKMIDVNVWRLTIMEEDGTQKSNLSYEDIKEAFYKLDSYSRKQFWKTSAKLGLYDILENILQK